MWIADAKIRDQVSLSGTRPYDQQMLASQWGVWVRIGPKQPMPALRGNLI